MNKPGPCVTVFWEDGYFLKTHFSLHRSENVCAVPCLFSYHDSHKHKHKEETYWTLNFHFVLPVTFYSKVLCCGKYLLS